LGRSDNDNMLSKQQLDKLRADIRFSARLGGRALILHSTWGLFSPREIDEGTRLLLKHIEVHSGDDCLDLVEVQLQQPLEDRVVIDGHTGQTVNVSVVVPTQSSG
jgi:hypothetical protein